MLAMAILAVLSIGTSLLYLQALRMHQRGSLDTTCRDQGALTLERIMPTVRDAYEIQYRGPDSLMLTLVSRDSSGNYVIDPTTKKLVPGNEVLFYRSDGQGTIEAFTIPPPPEEPPDPDMGPDDTLPEPDQGDPDIGYRGVSTGSYVWRAERAPDTSTWTNLTKVADNVEGFTINSVSEEDDTELVTIAVTIGRGTLLRHTSRTQSASVVVRNQ
jgi:hypothetical protein